MDYLNTVYVGNLKHDIDEQDISHFLIDLGYGNFVVERGLGRAPEPWGFCFVELEDLIAANNLRNELPEVSAQIGKCMPRRYSQCENQ